MVKPGVDRCDSGVTMAEPGVALVFPGATLLSPGALLCCKWMPRVTQEQPVCGLLLTSM